MQQYKSKLKSLLFVMLFSGFFHSGLYAQDNPFSYDEKTKLSYAKGKISQAKKEKLLSDFDKHFWEYFYPIYINSDTLIDFVYSGPYELFLPGHDGYHVSVFINDHDTTLHSILSEFGEVKTIEELDLSMGKRLLIDNRGCCAQEVYSLKTIYLLTWGDGLKVFSTESIQYMSFMEIPKDFPLNQRFIVTSPSYNLRAIPEVIEQDEKGNEVVLEIYKKGDIGTALASKTDSTGREWWFVIMDCNDDILCSNEEKTSIVNKAGWMSSRYLKSVK